MLKKYTPVFVLALTVGAVAVTTADVEAGWFFRGRGFRVAPTTQFIPVAPAPRPQLPSAPAGSTLTLPSNFLGPEPGSAFMVLQDIKLPARIEEWTESSVTLMLPPMQIRHPLRVCIDVVTPHGKLAVRKHMFITPPSDVVLHPGTPKSPLPTNPALIQQGALPAGN